MATSTCKTCHILFSVKSGSTGQFCSKSCSAKHNNKGRKRTEESKKAYSEYMKTTGRSPDQRSGESHFRFKHGKFSIQEKSCIICNTTFIGITKTCLSKTCRHEVCVRAGQLSASITVRRSKDEITLYNIISSFTFAENNKIIIDGWDADISLPEYRVAILWNGPWHYKEMPGLKHSLSQVQTRDRIKRKILKSNGWKVFIFEDRHWSPDQAAQIIKSWCQL